MRIGIFCGNLLPFHSKSLMETPLGGTETGVIHLANELSRLSNEVIVYTRHLNPASSSEQNAPKYRTIDPSQPILDSFDLFIAIRDWMPLFYQVNTKLRMMWTGDSYDLSPSFGIGDRRVIQMMDRLLVVSEWQGEMLSKTSGFPKEKVWVIGNGIDPSLFQGTETRHRKRLIYSSTPNRGMTHVPRLFLQLKKKHPELECHIFSSYKVYGIDELGDLENFKTESQKIPGFYFHGSILQKDLAREFMRSTILFYPCQFEETFCITAMEAQAAGCAIVTSKLAALPETVAEAGYLIDGKTGTPEYDAKFIEAADKILSDDRVFQKFSEFGKKNAENHTWAKVAARFDRFLKESF